ncbi:hypothetical protein BJ912DRAFT_939280 [Pholiota molesta]|nr:hypothetical protein BJ912DRAFT_939280 [Pholiota molesta]
MSPGLSNLVLIACLGRPDRSTFKDEVKASLAQCTTRPRLVGILATTSAPSKNYAEFTKNMRRAWCGYVLKLTGAAASPDLGEGEGVEEAIIEANEDESIHGIMVYFPIFGVQQDHYLQQVVSPLKDVEGLHFKFHYNLYHNQSPSCSANTPSALAATDVNGDEPPAGTVKSIIPCTPLAIVKCLEFTGVYNKILPYGDKAYGKTITIINRSEVVGRPLAALLSNDGARVISVDIDSIQEYTKRPKVPIDTSLVSSFAQRYHPRHVVHPSNLTLQEALAISDVVISATEWLKDGCVCVNVAADKNFEKDVRDKVLRLYPAVGKVTIFMLIRNLLRLQQYQNV